MTEELLSLYDSQHDDVGRLVRRGRTRSLGFPGMSKKDRTFQPPIRCIAMQNREYDSRFSEAVPVFVYEPGKTIFNVVFVGSALAGYVALTINNGRRWIVECRRENLDDVQAAHKECRITVFPGLWEFDFGELTDAQYEATSITVEPITDDENTTLCQLFDDVDSVIYTGAVIIREEAWCSVFDREEEPKAVRRDITDCIPYTTGSVKAGAIGLGIWSWDAGYLVNSWECRNFSFAAGYNQADDPALDQPDETDTECGGFAIYKSVLIDTGEGSELIWQLDSNTCTGSGSPEPPTSPPTDAHLIATVDCCTGTVVSIVRDGLVDEPEPL